MNKSDWFKFRFFASNDQSICALNLWMDKGGYPCSQSFQKGPFQAQFLLVVSWNLVLNQ